MQGVPAAIRRRDPAPSNPDPDNSKHRAERRRDKAPPATMSRPPDPKGTSCSSGLSDRSSAGRCRPNSSRARCGSYPARLRRCARRHRPRFRPHRQERRATEAGVDQSRWVRSIDHSPRRAIDRSLRGIEPAAAGMIPRDSERDVGGRHRCIPSVGGMDRAHTRRVRHDIDRPVAPLDQANARGVRDPARGDGLRDRNPHLSAHPPAQVRQSVPLPSMTETERSASRSRVANHIANSRQNAIPSQRCSRTIAFIMWSAPYHLNAAESS